MGFYILFLLLVTSLAAIAFFYTDNRKTIDVIIISVLVFISGFRDTIGADYNSYVSWYLNKTRDSDFEFGFVAIMKVFRWLHLKPEFLFFFFSFFTCYFFYLGIKKYTVNTTISLLFFVMIPSLYLTSFTLVRQSLSVAIGFYAFHFLIKKKYLAYCLWMLVGIAIHRALLIPFVLFILVYKYAKYCNVAVIGGVLVSSFLFAQLDVIDIFEVLFEKTRYIYYFKHQISEVNVFKLILLNIECILILFYFQKLKTKYPNQQYLVVLYCLSIVFINLFSKYYDMSRIATYFRVFEILVIADVLFLEFKLKRLVLFSFFYTLYLGAFITGLNTDFELNKGEVPTFIPYNNFFFESKELINNNLFYLNKNIK